MSNPQFVDGHPEPEWLSAWHDGELAGEAAAAVQAHVDGCAECRARVADYAELDAVGPWIDRELPDRTEWAGIDERLRARMDEEIAVPGLATTGRRRIEPPGFRLRWALATAAGLAVIVVGTRVVLDRDWGMGGILGPTQSVRSTAEVPAAGTAADEEAPVLAARRSAEGEARQEREGPRVAAPAPAESADEFAAAPAGADVAGGAAEGPAARPATADDLADAAANAAPDAATSLLESQAGAAAPLGRAAAETADSLAAARARIARGTPPAAVIEALLAEFDRTHAGIDATARDRARDADGAGLTERSAAKSAPAPASEADRSEPAGAGDPKRAALCRKALATGRSALALAEEYGIDISERLSTGALADIERCAD